MSAKTATAEAEWVPVDMNRPASKHANTLVDQSVAEADKLAVAVAKGNELLASGPIERTDPMPQPATSYAPILNDRARGWLKFLFRKSTTPDDWSSTGEPHEW